MLYLGQSDWNQLVCFIFVSQAGVSVLYVGESDWIQLVCFILVGQTAFSYCALSW